MTKALGKSHKRLIASVIAGVVIVASLGVYVLYSIKHSIRHDDSQAQVIKTNTKIKPAVKSVSSNMLVLGNTFWGRSIDEWSQKSELGDAYPFSRLNEFDRDKYDAWISGLECPMAENVHMTAAQQEANLQFNCPPRFAKEAAKWFDVFTLANNHTDNQGPEAFQETRKHLEKNGIQYFGHYDPTVLGDVCEIIALPVTVQLDNGKSQKGKFPVAMCGYHGVFRVPPAESVELMQRYSKYMLTFAFPHSGLEYKSSPDQIKIDLYRSMIDSGADVVFGDHAHWIQNAEAYKGHLIVYSMGNFMFDQQGNAEVTRSAGINLLLKTNGTNSSDLQKWLTLGEQCAKFQDDCLQQAEAQGLSRPKFTFTFDVVGSNDGNKIVKPATEIEMVSILQRLNWVNVVPELQAEY